MSDSFDSVVQRRDPTAERHQHRDRILTGFLYALTGYLFVLAPLLPHGDIGVIILDITLVLLLLTAVFAMPRGPRGSTWSRFVPVVVFVIAASARVAMRASPTSELGILCLLSAATLFTMAALSLLRQVVAPGVVNAHRLRGAVAVYLLLGLIWAFGYAAIDVYDHQAFDGLPPDTHETVHPGAPRMGQLVYFSFVTLTTVGYGDITPVHPLARNLAIVEALVGPLFLAVLLARLVSLEVAGRQA